MGFYEPGEGAAFIDGLDIKQIDPALIEAATAAGCNRRQLLWKVQLPLALPVLVGGFRVALLQVIATATIGR